MATAHARAARFPSREASEEYLEALGNGINSKNFDQNNHKEIPNNSIKRKIWIVGIIVLFVQNINPQDKESYVAQRKQCA